MILHVQPIHVMDNEGELNPFSNELASSYMYIYNCNIVLVFIVDDVAMEIIIVLSKTL